MMMLIWCWWWWWWWWWRWWRPRGRLLWKSCWWSKYDFALWYLAEPACPHSRRTGGSSCFQRGFLAPNRWRTKQKLKVATRKILTLRTLALQLTGFDDVVSFIYHIFFIDHKTYQIMLMVWSPYSNVLVDIKLYVNAFASYFLWSRLPHCNLNSPQPLQNTSHALIF